jgi:hypothetical chaperone protein
MSVARAPAAAGFDYGTSQCSIGYFDGDEVRLAPLEGASTRIASTLYAPRLQWSLDRHADETLDLTALTFTGLSFGEAALAAYLAAPTEGYFVKSPKSFLGARGLSELVKERFISVVAAMMANVKQYADQAAQRELSQVVLGRPVNFQGAGGEAENLQALTMLRAAAREAGFTDVGFLFEPVAAALEYEMRQNEEQCVLVVDIGGGTTDCSIVRVGPRRLQSRNRDDDILAHTGERIGGNDYDQMLALRAVMPHFGQGDGLNSGLPFANGYFVDAVCINDVNAQQRFFSAQTRARLQEFVRDGTHPERIQRLLALQRGRLSYRLLREVEAAKIALSSAERARVDLEFVEAGFVVDCDRHDLEEGAGRLLDHLDGLIDEVRRQAGVAPDVVYLTGGMAGSAVVRAHLDRLLANVPRVDSDHFASVTEGLTVWARRYFAQ